MHRRTALTAIPAALGCLLANRAFAAEDSPYNRAYTSSLAGGYIGAVTDLFVRIRETQMENLMAAAESYLLEGFRVNLGGLCELFPRLRGIFDALDDPFDPTRHRLVLGASPGERLRRQFETQAAVERIEASERRPVLLSFLDTASGLIDDTLTPGNIGTISGYRLKVDPAQPDEGIFFIHQVDGAETRVDTVTRNKPGERIFLVPAIPAGMRLWLEVRARFGEELRTGRLAATLETPV